MSLPPDLVEMLSAFAAARVRYLVVGGYAVSLHARPRTTKDLDLWLDPAPDNIASACAALRAFGLPYDIVEELGRARPDEIVWIGKVPARVDFMQALIGADFRSAWKRRVVLELGGVPVPFIGREDLLANKKAVGRPTDLRDVRAIERAGGRHLRSRSMGREKRRRSAR
jgi:hypothetical protein